MSLANGLNLVAPIKFSGFGWLTQSTPNGGWNGFWTNLQIVPDFPLPNWSGSRACAVRPDGVAAIFYVGPLTFPGGLSAPQGTPIRYTHSPYDGTIGVWPPSIQLVTLPD
jgi:hypothetical protein